QLEAWTHPPFARVVDHGFVWGRGASDDKAGVLAILEAVEGLVAEGFRPERTVYLAFGHDEEVGGDEGAGAITRLLEERDVRVAFSLDEGMAIVDGSMLGIDAPIAAVGIAEKGYVTLRLHCKAPGGHSSTPPAESALGCLARAIVRLEENPFPAHLDGVAGQMLEALAPHLSLPARVAVSLPSVFRPLLVSRLEQIPATNALIRTTTAVTMADAGVKENVLPSRARATVNFRVSPAEEGAYVRERVEELLADLPVEIDTLRVTDPSEVSSTRSSAWRLLREAIGEIAPDAVVAPGLVLGGTDSKHYARIAEDSYRFTPFRLGTGDMARIHGIDERLAIANYHELIRFFRALLRGGDALAPAS
ncbi:MAG: M20/M25/M40 family metallo-hydrolase, partial [Myxococcota bacterium]|nr:M20/M25/M40 family metallo-hydrolase [Myxococcota bacterium]